ncbi:MAG: metal-dependent transcriptional regulator [Candidatus Muirbacterium halophilum]|nr:metal-dependent transcriptional regulator [Candidatus Muirbacterium halophilum]MCK9477443.1 metal-dependent transcriptional regulator [Candidatus Muirbacterium halophilum]
MNLSKSLEDYLESIYVIMLEDDTVRLKKLAKKMNVKAPSALGAVRTLEKDNFVIHEKYGCIKLTQKGEDIARSIYIKHRIIYTFLNEILGLDKTNSEIEACNIEHHLSDETIDRFVKFTNFLKKSITESEFSLKEFHNHYNSIKKIETKAKKSSKIKKLNELEIFQHGIIIKIEGIPSKRRKIIEKGVLPKLEFKIVKKSTNSISVKLNDYITDIPLELGEFIITEVVE